MLFAGLARNFPEQGEGLEFRPFFRIGSYRKKTEVWLHKCLLKTWGWEILQIIKPIPLARPQQQASPEGRIKCNVYWSSCFAFVP